jgi:hypothetical protein
MTDYECLNGDIILNKMTTETQNKIQKLVTEKRSIELGAYGQLIIDYVQAHNIHLLTPKQSKNLLTFIQVIPNEFVADFWKKFQIDCKDVAHAWYGGADKAEVVKRIIGSLANPKTGTGTAA